MISILYLSSSRLDWLVILFCHEVESEPSSRTSNSTDHSALHTSRSEGKKREANIANQYGLTLVSDYLILKNIVALVDIYQSELLFILLCISLL
jgi:hypothetical protein